MEMYDNKKKVNVYYYGVIGGYKLLSNQLNKSLNVQHTKSKRFELETDVEDIVTQLRYSRRQIYYPSIKDAGLLCPGRTLQGSSRTTTSTST